MIEYAEETIEQKNEQSPFDGFEGFTCPDEWRHASACIDNLAEFKVVEWLFRNGIWDEWTEITTETFMHGYCDEEGLQVDSGTGLCKPSVIAGIRRAIQHGLIECEVDETNKTRIRKFYRIKVYIAEEQLVEYDNSDVNDVFEETFLTDEEPLHPSMGRENSNYLHNNITCENISRIQEIDILPERVNSKYKPKGKSKYPSFIRTYMEDYSSLLGDLEHTASNISQATNIYLAYIANGGDAKAFMELMVQAKEITQKKTCIRHKNSQDKRNAMPYFFACLRKASKMTVNC